MSSCFLAIHENFEFRPKKDKNKEFLPSVVLQYFLFRTDKMNFRSTGKNEKKNILILAKFR